MISSHEDVWIRRGIGPDATERNVGTHVATFPGDRDGMVAGAPSPLAAASAPAESGLGIDNFAFRYGGDQGQTAAKLVREYAGIQTDMLVMEGAYDYTSGADVNFSARDVARIGADGKLVMAYMSVGSMDDRRDQFTDALASQAAQGANGAVRGGPDEVFLRYWDEGGAQACNTTLLSAYEGWVKQLHDRGYDGAYLDVMDSYYRPEIQADLPGGTASQDYYIATGALLTMVKELKAYADSLGEGAFNLVLGHSPNLIRDYRQSATDTGQQVDGDLIAAVQQSVGAVVVESAVDFLAPDPTTRQILDSLAPGSPDSFGTADRLAITYGLSAGDALAYQVEAAEAGWRAYVAPHPAWAEGFTRTYPVFDVATDGDNALLASEANASLSGLGGNDLLRGNAAANDLRGDAGSDTIQGGDGDDRLAGGAGADLLIGGEAADAFVFLALGDSTGKRADLISDLGQGDVVDISAIDADRVTDGEQAFHLVRRFDGHVGELTVKYSPADGTTLLRVDVDGDGKADMTIQATGDHRGFEGFVL